jgi:hypothetical protein
MLEDDAYSPDVSHSHDEWLAVFSPQESTDPPETGSPQPLSHGFIRF